MELAELLDLLELDKSELLKDIGVGPGEDWVDGEPLEGEQELRGGAGNPGDRIPVEGCPFKGFPRVCRPFFRSTECLLEDSTESKACGEDSVEYNSGSSIRIILVYIDILVYIYSCIYIFLYIDILVYTYYCIYIFLYINILVMYILVE